MASSFTIWSMLSGVVVSMLSGSVAVAVLEESCDRVDTMLGTLYGDSCSGLPPGLETPSVTDGRSDSLEGCLECE